MSQEDPNQSPRQGMFAGRRVSVVSQEARARGNVAGCISGKVYRDGDIIKQSPVLLRAARYAVIGSRAYADPDEAQRGF